MPVSIIRGDITRIAVDAIVNAANSSLLGGGGVDGAIHRAAGPGLLAECRTLGGCPTGEARITKGYDLPCKYIIHTVGPVWRGGSSGEPELLASCYRSSIELAAEQGCRSVAFPLISAGVYGYPKADALRIATDTLRDCAPEDMDVKMVIFDHDPAIINRGLYDGLSKYILDKQGTDALEKALYEVLNFEKSDYSAPVEASPDDHGDESAHSARPSHHGGRLYSINSACAHSYTTHEESPLIANHMLNCIISPSSGDDLGQRIAQLDESFSQSLLRLISASGMTDAQCYKRANIDRKLFSKIRSDVNYRPSKPTAIAFAVALELDLEQTSQLLRKAGYALSRSSKFDIIIEYFIENRQYDIMRINEALFAFDQPLLAG